MPPRTSTRPWRPSGLLLIAALLIVAICSTQAKAPQVCQSCIYQQAAQDYRNAAAQCQYPPGRACLLATASYQDCLASQFGSNGARSCTPPSCSTACPSNGTGGTGGGSSAGGSIPNSPNAKAQAYGQLVGGIMQLLLGGGGEPSKPPVLDPEPSPEAREITSEQSAIDQQERLDQLGQELATDLAPDAADEVAATTLDDPDQATADATADASGDPQLNALAMDSTTTPDQEEDDTSGLPQNWLMATNEVQDTALDSSNPASSNLENIMQAGVDQIADKVGSDLLVNQNALQTGIEKVYQDVLDTGAESNDESLGSIVKDKAVSVAADKTTDYLLEQRDQLGCGGNEPESVEMAYCNLWQAANPTNLSLGLRTYLNTVMSRFDTFFGRAIQQAMVPLN